MHNTSGSFVGRAALLDHLGDVLARGRSFWLWGPTGQGKSALAEVLARDHDAHLVTVSDQDDVADFLNTLWTLSPHNSPAQKTFASWYTHYTRCYERGEPLLIIDDWHLLPEGFQSRAMKVLLSGTAPVGILSRAPAVSVLSGDALLELEHLFLPPLDRESERELAKFYLESRQWPEGLPIFVELSEHQSAVPLCTKLALHELLNWRSRFPVASRPEPQQLEAMRRGVEDAYLPVLLDSAEPEELDVLRLWVHLPDPIPPRGIDFISKDSPPDPRHVWMHRGVLADDGAHHRVVPHLKDLLARRLKLKTTAQRINVIACLRQGYFEEACLDYLLPLIAQTGALLSAAPTTDAHEELTKLMDAVNEHFEGYLASGQHEAFARALEALPESVLHHYPLVHCRLAQAYFFNDQFNLAERIFELNRKSLDPRAEKVAFGYLQHFALSRGQVPEVLQRYSDRYSTASFEGDDVLWLFFYAATLYQMEDFSGARAVARQGQCVALENKNVRYQGIFEEQLGACEFNEGNHEEGLVLQRRACAALAEGGFKRSEAVGRYRLARNLLSVSIYQEALEEIERAIELLRRWRERASVLTMSTLLRAECLFHCGRIEEFEEVLESVREDLVASDRSFVEGELARLKALQESLSGDRDKERRLLREAFDVMSAVSTGTSFLRALYAYSQFLFDQGDVAELRRVAMTCEPLHPSSVRTPRVRHLLGELAMMRGDIPDAWRRFEVIGRGSDTLFPRPDKDALHPFIESWCASWENLFHLGLPPGEPEPWTRGGDSLKGLSSVVYLYLGWQAALERDSHQEARRHWWQARGLAQKTGIFAFMHGLLDRILSDDACLAKSTYATMLGYWVSLPDELLQHQMDAWRNAGAGSGKYEGELARRTEEELTKLLDLVFRSRIEGEVIVDLRTEDVYVDEIRHEFNLSSMPYRVLHALARADEPIDIPELYEQIWELPYYAESSKNTVYTTVMNLKRVLADVGAEAPVIDHARGVGYSLARRVLFVNDAGED